MLIAALLAAAPPVPVTMADLRRFPERYDGKQVQVTGQVDDCWGMHCALCPENAALEALDADCVPIEFDPAKSELASADRLEHGYSFDAAYRYADVVLVARFDPACLTSSCTDNATLLLNAHVTRVLRRRHSWEGITARGDRLYRVDDKAAAPAIAVFRDALARTRAEQAEQDRQKAVGPMLMPDQFDSGVADVDRVFTTDRGGRLGSEAVVCRSPSIEILHRIDWPQTETAALYAPSSEDLYRCFLAFERDGRWAIRLPMK